MYHINWTYFCTFIIIIIVIISFQFAKEAWNHFLSFWYWFLKVLESKYIPVPIPIQIHFICRSSGAECVIFYFIHFDGRDKRSLFLSHDLESLGTNNIRKKKKGEKLQPLSAQPSPTQPKFAGWAPHWTSSPGADQGASSHGWQETQSCIFLMWFDAHVHLRWTIYLS